MSQRRTRTDDGTGSRRSRIKGRLLTAAGSALLLLGSFGVFGARILTRDPGRGLFETFWQDLVTVLIGGGIVCGTGGLLYSRGQRHLQPTAEEVTARDTRPPVLYLRSFLDDSVTRRSTLAGSYAYGYTQYTEEQELAQALEHMGPFIAVGEPGEELPQLGASRLYMDEGWQARVIDLMTGARLVVLRLGTTEGLWWEFEQARTRLSPERLLLLVPDGTDEYERFRRRAWTELAVHLPPYSPVFDFPDGGLSMRGAIFFGPDGTPYAIPFRKVPVPVTRASTVRRDYLRRTLHPVFAQLHRDV
ncbi:hypothetical protein [Streptomyces sp. SP18CS02]|uniref:hypothetical protein n=1 Tax=Streptomyces sp. SP18CS02 TaxID=3002531 RepID=UPI002E765954|nr:hypothetical protein [Streptomyces sp. SP18CS02]MEE1753968.1 hypothetical protein [Streptomyces sp. SP18CS02]